MANSNQTPPRYGRLTDTRLYARLIQPGDAVVQQLAANVRAATQSAAELAGTIGRHMPLYTLHNERHFLNIIGWMERLLGEDGIEILSPLEAALVGVISAVGTSALTS